MEWFFAGVLFAVFNAITMLVNQNYKLDGHLLSGMRGIGVALIALPFTFFFAPPESPIFWILILAEGLLSSFFNSRLYSSSAKYGAGATSRISILAVMFGVVMWWIYDYTRFLELCRYPVALGGIIISLAVVLWGAILMKKSQGKNDTRDGVSAFRYMLPAVIVLAMMMIVRKEIMQSAEFISAAVYYCAVAIFISGALNILFFIRHTKAEELKRDFSQNLKTTVTASILIATASFITIFFGNLSSYKSPDPAYVTAITLLSPIVVIFYNRFRGVRDKFSMKSIILMFVGIGALIYFADIQLPPPVSSVFSRY